MPYEITEIVSGGSAARDMRRYEAYYEDGSTRRLEGINFGVIHKRHYVLSPSGRKVFTGEDIKLPVWVGIDLVDGVPQDVRQFPGYQGIRRRVQED